MKDPIDLRIDVEYPIWVHTVVDWDKRYRSDVERMDLAIDVARANVQNHTGGPYGAAVFESRSGRLLAVGMNSVLRLQNSTLHAEMVAFMMAQRRIASFTLDSPDEPAELVTSCDPCAMCLGAILWSGARRVVCGAAREDAARLGFDEGPVFPQSYRYLEDRGIEIVRGVQRDRARDVLEMYRTAGGVIYNR
jgi:tRNA(Arg) A34 adenosine deaminase TadA